MDYEEDADDEDYDPEEEDSSEGSDDDSSDSYDSDGSSRRGCIGCRSCALCRRSSHWLARSRCMNDPHRSVSVSWSSTPFVLFTIFGETVVLTQGLVKLPFLVRTSVASIIARLSGIGILISSEG